MPVHHRDTRRRSGLRQHRYHPMHGAAIVMRSNAKWIIVALAGVVLAIASVSGVSFAGNCTISTTPVTFGNYNVFSSTDTTANGKVTYNCSGGAISISIDNGGASSCAGRRMLNGSEALSYNVYLDAALSMVWGTAACGQIYTN